MQLVPNSNCILCDQNTAVLACIDRYIQFVCDAFFETNEHEKNEFQKLVSYGSLCILCAYKITLAFKFKKKYESKHKENKKARGIKTECSLCGSKSNEVFESETNPNDFKAKIDSFMSCSSHPKPYRQWITCFDCVFGLSTWFEIHSNILKRLHINSQVGSTLNCSYSKDTFVSSTTNNTSKRNTIVVKSSVKMPPIRHSRRKSLNLDVAFLKKCLKHLKSVEQTSKKLNCDDGVEDDKKMFKDIPYVLIINDNKKQRSSHKISTPAKSKAKPKPKSKAAKAKPSNNNSLNDTANTINERRSSRLNKPLEIIELSDTESEGKDHKENKKPPVRARPSRAKPPAKAKSPPPTKAKAKKKSNVKPRPTKQLKKKKSKGKMALQSKSPFKIRVSSKFILPPESVEQTKTYTCSICDKWFNVNCTYKVHKLWHEKPECIVINVTRHDFSDHINKKSQEADLNKPLKKKFRIISDININNAICKDLVSDERNESDIDVSTKQTDDEINNVDLANDDERIADSSNKENDNSEDVTQNETSEIEETNIETTVAENENDTNEKEELEEQPSQGVDTVHDKETDETSDKQSNEEGKSDDDEKVDIDSQEEINGQDLEEENEERNTESGIEDHAEDNEETEHNHVNEITDNGKDVESGSEEETQNVQETENSDEENESENDYSNSQRDSIDDKVEVIERQLAEIHGEEENNGESNEQDEPETDEPENDEPLSLKRKRVDNSDVSDNEENADNNEKVTPKTKRVRFATDFEAPNDEPLDLNISNNYSEEKNENLGKSWCTV